MAFYGAILLAAFSGIVAVVAESCVSSLSDKAQACAQQNGVSMDQLNTVVMDDDTPILDNSCFNGCILSSLGAIDDDGMIVQNVLEDELKCIVSGSEFNKLSSMLNQCCAMVNGQSVSDGTAGCDRSNMLVACLGQDGSEVVKAFQGQNN